MELGVWKNIILCAFYNLYVDFHIKHIELENELLNRKLISVSDLLKILFKYAHGRISSSVLKVF